MKTIGIKLADGSFYPVLEEGKPSEKALDLTTAHNNQTKIMVDLYRSANCTMEDAEYVDSLQIENLIEHPNGEPDISFQVSIDENNELSAQIIDTETGNRSDTTITLVSRTIQERLITDEYNISDTIVAELDQNIDTEDPDSNTESDTNAPAVFAAGAIAGGGLLAAANAIREAQKTESDDSQSDDTQLDITEMNPDIEETPEEKAFNEEVFTLGDPDTNATQEDFDFTDVTEEQPVETEETAVSEEEVFDVPQDISDSEQNAVDGIEGFSFDDDTLDNTSDSTIEADETDNLADDTFDSSDIPATENFEFVEDSKSEESDSENMETEDSEIPNINLADMTELDDTNNLNNMNDDMDSIINDDTNLDDFNTDDLSLDNNSTEDTEATLNDSFDDFLNDKLETEETSNNEETSSFDFDGSSSALPDFDFPDDSDTNIVAPEDDYSLPDFNDIPDIENTDDLFNDTTTNDMPISGSGISFTGLYDTETELGKSAEYAEDDVSKKTKIPVIICVICAIICILATLFILFVIPSKFNLLKKKAPKEAVQVEKVNESEKIEEEDSESFEENFEEELPDLPDEADEMEEPTVPEAVEDEIIVIEKAEEVVPLPPPVVEEAKPKNTTYKIKWGDTLWDIADTYYKNPWKYKYIARYNGIKDPDYIISGNYIIIPAE